MKKYLVLLITLLFLTEYASAQSFQDGVQLYENEQYEEAIDILRDVNSDEALLFIGKSYLALGNYPLTRNYLNQLQNSERTSIQQEAEYTKAVLYFRTKDYSSSLNTLSNLIESNNRSGIQIDARRLYNQIIRYLDTSEQFEVLQNADSRSLRMDIARQSKRQMDEPLFRSVVNELLRLEPDTSLHDQILETLDLNQVSQSTTFSYPTAPEGTVYHIGVVLPTFDEEDPDFTIPRNLYYGFMLAAEEFNSRNPDKKVQLIFKNSAESPDTTAMVITELAWGHHADAVIGPLFSDTAQRMAELAEEYQVPMLAPLANSDELNLDYNYTFQFNPTFEVHGKNMAQYAVQELGLDTLAVITEVNSLGRESALAFRKEAERLGAFVSYYIEDDFASKGYDLSEYTEVFTPDEALIDSLGYTPTQAIYAPFTGQASTTMASLLMNDLEAMRSRQVILGSEEWQNVDLSAYQRRTFEIFHTQASGTAADSTTVAYFEEDFSTRFSTSPDRFARMGYDTATFLFQSLETAGNPSYLGRVLRNKEIYNGLALQIHFDGRRINQKVYVKPLTTPAQARLEDEPNPED
ncbi:ABC transporter substrate-binding protein [Rhodohalobacter sp.]|uniref:ABC transporter substrate-binding protein n=1 Tax=Rhodohalobacter sp. TaxID=1974210 RepID=UPI003564BB22